MLESFDPVEQGLGKREKAVYPRAFLYLLEDGAGNTQQQATPAVSRTLERAIERIHDPVEGGFFRYAETRDWQIPHYEKMADLNAGTALLLYRLNELAPAPTLAAAADATLGYIRTALYDPEAGVFMSFQEADTRYYALGTRDERSKARPPAVIDKVFIDRLALTITYLLDVLEYRPADGLDGQISRSLDFVTRSMNRYGEPGRYYTLSTGQWSGEGTLLDYVLVARMYLGASSRLHDSRYAELARELADKAIDAFYDERLAILTDPSLGDTDDAEFLMEVNGLLAQTLLGVERNARQEAVLDSIITYFSGMGEILEERLWDGQDWAFTERYVPYLRAVDSYLAGPASTLAVSNQ